MRHPYGQGHPAKDQALVPMLYVYGIAAYVVGITAYVIGIAAYVAGIAVHVARIAVPSSACCSDQQLSEADPEDTRGAGAMVACGGVWGGG